MYVIYSILFHIVFICCLPLFALKMLRQGKYKEGLRMRFGQIPKHVQNQLRGQSCIWLHTVSVGEFLSAESLIFKLQERYPEYPVVLSTTTNTAHALAKKRLSSKHIVLYSPLDFSWAVQSFMDQLKPKALIIAETEIWPNLLRQAQKKNLPHFLINARISDQSFRSYRRISRWLKPLLQGFQQIGARSQQDLERLFKLGASKQQLTLTGNLKNDQALVLNQLQQTKQDLKQSLSKQWILVAGSTHPGEEDILIRAYKKLQKQIDSPGLLVLVPRHIHRSEQLEQLILDQGLRCHLHTSPQSAPQETEVYLVNTIGELPQFYSQADLVFVGGSLVPHGGQNILEPAVLGKSIVFGPHMHNFRELTKLYLANKAAIQVHNQEELFEQCLALLSSSELRSKLGEQAAHLAKQGSGALNKTLALITLS